MTESPAQKPNFKKPHSVWILWAHLPRILDPHESLFVEAPPGYPNCREATPLTTVWNDVNYRSGFPIWKACTYDSKIDYKIPGGGNYSIQDWNNPNPSVSSEVEKAYVLDIENWHTNIIPWQLRSTR